MKMQRIRQIVAVFLSVLMVCNLALPTMATATNSNVQQEAGYIEQNIDDGSKDNVSESSEASFEENTESDSSDEESERAVELESSAQESEEETEPESSAQDSEEETEPESSAQDSEEETEPESSAQDSEEEPEQESSTQEPEVETGTGSDAQEKETDVISPEACEECGQTEGHAEECSQYVVGEVAPSVAEQLMQLDTIEEIYMGVLDLMQNDSDALLALTVDEIADLRAYIAELDPEGDDTDTQDLLDTLAVLPNGGEALVGNPVMLPAATISSSSVWEGNSSISENTTWTFQSGAVVTLKNPITVLRNKTLTLEGWGSFARHSTNTSPLFIVQEGGRLIIEGESEESPFIIDGNEVIARDSLIKSSGELNFKNTIVQDGKNRSINTSNKPNGNGGGIYVTSTGSLSMDECVVTRNTASLNGGGIHCAGKMTIEDSTISWNRAASAETGPSEVNSGRGGGFNLTGEFAEGNLSNVIIEENAAMYYGGGGQIQSSASLTMNEGTIFQNNTAILHGAGALHVTADAKFTMDGGVMQNNTAQTVGGAIHSSYSCQLILNSGEILNNTANGRGGGVHVNTGGAITLGEGLTIAGNRANDEATGSAAKLDATGDVWSDVQKNGAHANNGYGGGVLIDSGTCTVAGATINGNSAEVGGGGIALVMLNVSDSGLDDVEVVNFTMTSGVISNNTTEGNGAGVYLMSNMAKENIISVHGKEDTQEYKDAIAKLKDQSILTDIPVAEILAGIVSENEADSNGGGLYLGDKTKFIINGGEVAGNEAIDGAGVYVASGEAEINGGTMKSNIASQNGGALYISGDVTVTDGVLGTNVEGGNDREANQALNGGALYVAEGNVLIEHGVISGNKAENGGAVYLKGTENTTLAMESGEMKHNYASEDGGAIYATSGTLTIGLKDCLGDDDALINHTDKGEGRHHPIIEGNKAADCGGGIAMQGLTNDEKGEGIVHFYCGKAIKNEALYKGVGKNVFMYGGEFYFYDGANVGVPRDPDLVIIGGELHSMCDHTRHINLEYFKNNTETGLEPYKGLATFEGYMNLPEGEYFFEKPEGMRFIGWTPYGAESEKNSTVVRDKADYKPSGTPIQITDAEEAGRAQGTFDETEDETMKLYAIWAPEENNISFVDSLLSVAVGGNQTYNIDVKEKEITINVPDALSHEGFEIVGWYIYQSKEKNGNWCDITRVVDGVITEAKSYEPVYTLEPNDYNTLNYRPSFEVGGMKYYSLNDPEADIQSAGDGKISLKVPELTFGDIILIPDYALTYGDLMIEKSGADLTLDPEQTFVFDIKKTSFDAVEELQGCALNETLAVKEELDALVNMNVDMTVAIEGNGSVTITNLPIGYYRVTEDTSWSWRYDPDEETKDVHLSDVSKDVTVTFVNTRDEKKWFDGNSRCQNLFASSSIGETGEGERGNIGAVKEIIAKKPDDDEILFG